MSDHVPTERTRPRLLDQVRAAIRLRHYSRRTEGTYVGWIRRYIVFHGKRHPREMGPPEVAVFLTHLAERAHVVRDGKGAKDRPVPLPVMAMDALVRQMDEVRRLHQRDLAAGYGRVMLPDALARKYPNAAAEFRWQFVFPAARLCRDPRWGSPSRYRLHESAVQRAVAEAATLARIDKRVSCHVFRHHADSRIMPRVCPANAAALGRMTRCLL